MKQTEISLLVIAIVLLAMFARDVVYPWFFLKNHEDTYVKVYVECELARSTRNGALAVEATLPEETRNRLFNSISVYLLSCVESRELYFELLGAGVSNPTINRLKLAAMQGAEIPINESLDLLEQGN
jgi:hypothetical protein